MQNYTDAAFAALMEINFPVCLWGNPGVGKSARVHSLGGDKWGVVTLLVSSLSSPSEMTGIRYESGGEVKVAKPEWVDMLEAIVAAGKTPILFLDELNTASQMVQAPALRVIAERVAGCYPLPPECRIVVAVNPPEIAGGAMTEAMLNRMAHLAVDGKGFLPWLLSMELSAWADQPHRVGASIVLRSFLEGKSDLVDGLPTQENPAAPSPRVWEQAALPVLTKYMEGSMGADALVPVLSAVCGRSGQLLAQFVLEDASNLLERGLADTRLLESPIRGILWIRELLRTDPDYVLKTRGWPPVYAALGVAMYGRAQALPLLAIAMKSGVGWGRIGDFTQFVNRLLAESFRSIRSV